MGVYFGETEITNFDNLVPVQGQDITQAFFGSTEVFTVWGEYDGTLPATYTANGSALADYRIYGAAGGVGDDSGTAYGYEVDIHTRSKNIFNPSGEWRKPYSGSTITVSDTTVTITGSWFVYQTIEVMPNTDYYISFDILSYIVSYGCAIYAANADGTINNSDIISGRFQGSITINSGGRTRIALLFYSGNSNAGMCAYDRILMELASESTEFQPYSNITTPIYIGSDPLGEDEYVDYGEGKIYRRTVQLFNKNTVVTGGYISLSGEKQNENYCYSDFIPISAGSYYLKNVTGASLQNSAVVYDANKRALRYANVSGAYTTKGTITLTDDDAYIRVNVYKTTNLDTVDIIAGSIEPTEHIPYVAPVDPPVPLPALPTVDGTTITDYAGQSAAVPSRFTAKYRKEGFK